MQRSTYKDRVNKVADWSLYVLELEDDFYYVGITQSNFLSTRFLQHCGEEIGVGHPSHICTLHRPKKIIYSREFKNTLGTDVEKYEDLVTKNLRRSGKKAYGGKYL